LCLNRSPAGHCAGVIPVHRARSIVEFLRQETPDFISLDLCSHLNPVEYKISGCIISIQEASISDWWESGLTLKRPLLTRKCGNCSCIATCSLARSTRSHSLALACAHQNSFTLSFLPVHLLARTHLNSLELGHTRSQSLSVRWLALARTRSPFLELSRTRFPVTLFSFYSLRSCYSSNEFICNIATKFCGKNFDR